jgi:signal transduction histidine kinase
MFIGTTAAASDTPQLQLSEPQSTEALSEYIYVFRDPKWEQSIETIVAATDDLFSPLATPTPEFGFTDDLIWLRIKLSNPSPDPGTAYLHVHENFLQKYEVYLQRADGQLQTIESHGLNTKFSERSIEFPELVTKFNYEGGEEISLFIAYWSEGSSKISLSLETETSFSAKSLLQTSKNFVSYGMMLILILISSLALFILRMRVFLAYSVYVIVTLLFLVHSDGVAFQYLWPSHPSFNSYFSIIIGLAFAIVPYNFARTFLRTKTFHPQLDKLMVWMMVIMPLLVIPGAVIDAQSTKKYLMLMVLLAIAIGIFAGLVAARTRFKEVRFYLFAWVVGGFAATLMNIRHFTELGIAQDAELDSIRIAIVVDAVMMGLGVADRYRQQMKARRTEEKRALKQAELNLKLNNRLQALEERYLLATELVASRDAALKNTVHDLRQPLHALRLNVKNLQNETGKSVDQDARFEDTFSYLETLITGYLQDSVSEQISEGSNLQVSQATEKKRDDENDLSLPKILLTIHEMFLPDAKEKGLDFRFVKTSAVSSVDPLKLMRIITNLVANAIKFTPDGVVLLGVKRVRSAIQIEVHDTGIGMSAEEFGQAQFREIRLNKSFANGHGFGLAIAKDLAADSGCELIWLERAGKGTSLALRLPSLPINFPTSRPENGVFT